MNSHELRRDGRKAINRVVWAQLESERAVYAARMAIVRAEKALSKALEAESCATGLYTCAIESLQYLAGEVRGGEPRGDDAGAGESS
jgi:hypothetical protein